MKNIIFLALAILSIITFSSCKVETTKDYGPSKNYPVNVKDFSAVRISYPCDVVYVPSDTFSVVVKAPEKLRDRLQVFVNDGELVIKEQEKSNEIRLFDNGIGHALVLVKAPVLVKVDIAGSGDFACKSTIKAPQFYMSISGSGDIDIKNIEANAVIANIAGSGDIDAGLTNVAKTGISIAGSGDIDMNLNNCGDVKASIAGSGDITLTGKAKTFHSDVSGVGDVDTSKLELTK